MKNIIITQVISSLSLLSFGKHPTNLNSSGITTNTSTCQWAVKCAGINGGTDSIFTPLELGVYYVTVTDTNACSADSYSIQYTISTIEDYSSSINIFPTPTNGNITVNSEYGIKTIELYNTIGNELLSVNNNENKITETQLDLSTFAKGVYFIKINIDNQIINQRIILQ